MSLRGIPLFLRLSRKITSNWLVNNSVMNKITAYIVHLNSDSRYLNLRPYT